MNGNVTRHDSYVHSLLSFLELIIFHARQKFYDFNVEKYR